MPENFYFGGGAAGSAMHPVVLVLTLAAAVLVFFLPRRYVTTPAVCASFLLPLGAELYLDGLHFYVTRIVALAAICRLVREKVSSGHALIPGGITLFDKIFFFWALSRGLALMLLHRELAAVVNQLAFWLDTFGLYLLFRFSIRDHGDVVQLLRALAVVTTMLAACMVYEHRTGFNFYNLISEYEIVPYTRDGTVRAQACFGTAITAGTFGATLLPLYVWAWKSKKAILTSVVGMATALVVVLRSLSSTPVSACLAVAIGLCLWPARKWMREIRWAIAGTIGLLALIMKAPVWYLIQRVDFVGGHGWDRAYLLDQFARHISDWWLVGTDQNANWGSSTWDRCNQYVAEAASGGMLTLVLFIALLCMGFSIAGRGCQRVRGIDRWFYWCLGTALFTHVVAFHGVSYWDQMRVSWILLLAIFPAADAWAMAQSTQREAAAMESANLATGAEAAGGALPAAATFMQDLDILTPGANPAN